MNSLRDKNVKNDLYIDACTTLILDDSSDDIHIIDETLVNKSAFEESKFMVFC